MRGKHIVITGCDGSGKSAVLAKLRELGYNTCSWHDMKGDDQYRFLHHTLSDPVATLESLGPLSRAATILAIVSAFYEGLIKPPLSDGEIVISDSYIYRFFAKEKVFNKCCKSLSGFIKEFPEPDAVIVLDVQYETAYLRKIKTGLHAYEYLASPNSEDFVVFQRKVSEEVIRIAPALEVTVIDASASIDDVVNEVISVIKTLQFRSK